MPELLTPIEVARELARNYFNVPTSESRVYEDDAGVAVLLALVRGSKRQNVVGLRLLDFAVSPPTLRLWNRSRWSEANFEFDFTGDGDPGAGTTQAASGAVTFCVQADKDIVIVPGMRGKHLDPSVRAWELPKGEVPVTAKFGIDATRPEGIHISHYERPVVSLLDEVKLDDYF